MSRTCRLLSGALPGFPPLPHKPPPGFADIQFGIRKKVMSLPEKNLGLSVELAIEGRLLSLEIFEKLWKRLAFVSKDNYICD